MNLARWAIFAVLLLIFSYVLYSFRASFDHLEDRTFFHFMTLVFAPLVFIFTSYSVATVLTSSLAPGVVPKNFTAQTTGVIEHIDFSGVRVNGVPLPEAKVAYADMSKVFSPLPQEFRINFEKGDEVVIAHHPDNLKLAAIDIAASMAAKNQGE